MTTREPKNYTPLSRDAAKEDLYLAGVKPWAETLDELLSTKPFADVETETTLARTTGRMPVVVPVAIRRTAA